MRGCCIVLVLAFVAACAPYYHPGYPHYPEYPDTGRGRLPPGSYRQSCTSLRFDGWLLKAVCRRADGSWRNTALDLRGCDRPIVNDDGRLRCGQGGPSNIPRGSYARSCTGIHVRKGMLECDCRTVDGRWRRNSVRVDACERFANVNGRLGCE